MSRAGRTRKSGPRHPGGQLKRLSESEREAAERITTARQPHRRALAHQLRAAGTDDADVKKLSAGEEAESPIGRLWAAGKLRISDDHDSQAARDRYDAGNMFAQVVGAYRSVIGAPQDGASEGRGFPCQELLCNLDEDTRSKCECLRRKERYDRAHDTLAALGRRALMAVNAVAIHRQTIGEEDLVYLVAGLQGLRRLYGLTAPRKSKHYRNTF